MENCLRWDFKPIEENRAFGPSWTAEGTRLPNSPSRLLSHTPLSTEPLPYSTFRPTLERAVGTWCSGTFRSSRSRQARRSCSPVRSRRGRRCWGVEPIRRSPNSCKPCGLYKRPAPTARPEPVTVDVGGVIVSLHGEKEVRASRQFKLYERLSKRSLRQKKIDPSKPPDSQQFTTSRS